MPRSIAAARSTWSEPMPGGDGELQLRRLGDPLRREVRGPERLRDDDVGVGELALELGVRPVLVGGDDEAVSALFEERAQPEPAGDAAEQLARREVDPLRRRRGLTRRSTARSSGCRRGRTPAGIRPPDRRRARRARSPSPAHSRAKSPCHDPASPSERTVPGTGGCSGTSPERRAVPGACAVWTSGLGCNDPALD